jgi:hypothetical protein
VYVSNQAEPGWRVVAELAHLVVERQFHDKHNVEAVMTGCGQIVTPSNLDRRLSRGQVGCCRVRKVVEAHIHDHAQAVRTS